ncbi:MAG: hypothetical protein ABI663_04605 [Chryseolinea sp.]
MIILYFVGTYLVFGFLFSMLFLFNWIYKVDEAAHETPWTFKLTLLPGCMVFWPVLLKKFLLTKRNHHD